MVHTQILKKASQGDKRQYLQQCKRATLRNTEAPPCRKAGGPIFTLTTILVLFFSTVPTACAFHQQHACALTLRQHLDSTKLSLWKSQNSKESNNNENAPKKPPTTFVPGQLDEEYNDDAFGLVFLTSGLALQDFEFAGTFLALSAIVAAATNTGYLKVDRRIPGLIALVALLFRGFVFSFRSGHGLLDGFSEAPPTTEILICAASLAWAFFGRDMEKKL